MRSTTAKPCNEEAIGLRCARIKSCGAIKAILAKRPHPLQIRRFKRCKFQCHTWLPSMCCQCSWLQWQLIEACLRFILEESVNDVFILRFRQGASRLEKDASLIQ